MVIVRRVALVTGAAGAIGAAAAERLVGSGYAVVLVDIAGRRLARTAARLGGSRDAAVLPYELDTRDRRALEEACADATARLGAIRYVFASAGIGHWANVVDLSPGEWDRVMEVNLTGTFHVCQTVLPAMLRAGGGSIVLMSSDLAIIGRAGYASYTASKTAIYGLTKALAIELGPTVRVNAIGPGPIDTPHLRAGRTGSAWRRARRRYVAGIPLGRLGTPRDIAPLVEYLFSPQAASLNGQLLQPNGGQVMW